MPDSTNSPDSTNFGSWSENELPKCGNTRIDPYLIWARSTDYKYFNVRPGKNWLPLIIEVNGSNKCRSAAAFVSLVESCSWIDVPGIYRHPALGLSTSRFLTSWIDPDAFFLSIQEDPLCNIIKRFEISHPLGPPGEIDVEAESLDKAAARESKFKQSIDEAGVEHKNVEALWKKATASADPHSDNDPMIGIVDDGIAFLHQRFRLSSNETRIEYFGNQTRPGHAGFHNLTQTAMAGLGYGYECSKIDIDAMLKDKALESHHYQSLGYFQVRSHLTHGTAMLDIATGASEEELFAKEQKALPVFCVQVREPPFRGDDTSGRWLPVFILDALRYLIDRSDQWCFKKFYLTAIRKKQPVTPKPIIINISYGNLAGPHDGSSILEAAIDELIEKRQPGGSRQLAVVIAAGNNYLSRCHAQIDALQPNQSDSISWRILPDDATPSFLEIWLPARDIEDKKPQVSVEIQPPRASDASSGEIKQDQFFEWKPVNANSPLCSVIYMPSTSKNKGNHRAMIMIAVAPTKTYPQTDTKVTDTTIPKAPCGDWRITLRNYGTETVKNIHMWIQRDETFYGQRRRGRQSRFEDEQYQRYVNPQEAANQQAAIGTLQTIDTPKSKIRRAATLNAIATGQKTIVAGAYRESDDKIAIYSAAPFDSQTDPEQVSMPYPKTPNALAIADRSVTTPGVLAAGSFSGAVVSISGTSVAAAQITRFLAEAIDKDDALTYSDLVDGQAIIDERERGGTPVEPPPQSNPTRKGHGRLFKGRKGRIRDHSRGSQRLRAKTKKPTGKQKN